MKILFLTKGDKTVPSSRWRVWLLAEHLKNRYGYNYDVICNIGHSFWIPSFKRFSTLKNIYCKLKDTTYNLIYIHKSIYPRDVIFLILFAKWWWRKCLIYDLDDAEWIHSPAKSKLLARNADIIIAGSHIILEWARAFNRESVMIPSVVDHEIYQRHQVRHTKNALPSIGWIGMGKGHFLDGHFAMIRPALDLLSKKGVAFQLVIIGSQHYQPLKNYFADASFPVVFLDTLDWADPESVPETIKYYGFAVGLMPTSDTPFNRAKCAGKAIEYMACGVPVVASPVGENKIVVEHGISGFWAASDGEWAHAIAILLGDTALRKKMGEVGREKVRSTYSYKALMPTYRRIIEGALPPQRSWAIVDTFSMQKVSILIAAYDERATIREVVERTKRADTLGLEKEIIIIEDCSTDGTRAIVEELQQKDPSLKVIFHERNEGVGASLRDGMRASNGEIIIRQDADTEYQPEDFPALLAPILEGRVPIVFGSRILGFQSQTSSYRYRTYLWGGILINAMYNWILWTHFTDVLTASKAFRRDVLEKFSLESTRFELESELIAKMVRAGFPILEVPITYHARTFEEGKKIRWYHTFRILRTLLWYRFAPLK